MGCVRFAEMPVCGAASFVPQREPARLVANCRFDTSASRKLANTGIDDLDAVLEGREPDPYP